MTEAWDVWSLMVYVFIYYFLPFIMLGAFFEMWCRTHKPGDRIRAWYKRMLADSDTNNKDEGKDPTSN